MNEEYNSISTYLGQKSQFDKCVEKKTKVFLEYINGHAGKAYYLSDGAGTNKYECNCDQIDFKTTKGPILDFDSERGEYQVITWDNSVASLLIINEMYEEYSSTSTVEEVIKESFENDTYEKLKENFDYSMNTLERNANYLEQKIKEIENFVI